MKKGNLIEIDDIPDRRSFKGVNAKYPLGHLVVVVKLESLRPEVLAQAKPMKTLEGTNRSIIGRLDINLKSMLD